MKYFHNIQILVKNIKI